MLNNRSYSVVVYFGSLYCCFALPTLVELWNCVLKISLTFSSANSAEVGNNFCFTENYCETTDVF